MAETDIKLSEDKKKLIVPSFVDKETLLENKEALLAEITHIEGMLGLFPK